MSDLVTIDTNISKGRARIGDLAQNLISGIESGEYEEQECPVTHRFAKGCYLREILMPKGTLIVGKIHATEHFNVILTGKCTVATAEWVKTFEAPCTFISGEGVQKVVLVHEDCRWQTLHVTDKTDLDEIESEVIVDSYDQLVIDSLVGKIREVTL